RCADRAGLDPTRDAAVDDALDLPLGEARREGDPRRSPLPGLLVARRHVHDAIRVDLERDVDLDLAARAALEIREFELTELLVLVRLAGLALVDADLDRLLIVARRGERAGLLDRHRRVAPDHRL